MTRSITISKSLKVCVSLLHGAFGLDLAAEVVEVVAVDDGCRFQAKRINELTQVLSELTQLLNFKCKEIELTRVFERVTRS
ncbi:hypothetical protein QYF36_020336 [Acer negundo]|nr:hypothetical protein QYF36_020336 [Acer negundo]